MTWGARRAGMGRGGDGRSVPLWGRSSDYAGVPDSQGCHASKVARYADDAPISTHCERSKGQPCSWGGWQVVSGDTLVSPVSSCGRGGHLAISSRDEVTSLVPTLSLCQKRSEQHLNDPGWYMCSDTVCRDLNRNPIALRAIKRAGYATQTALFMPITCIRNDFR